MKLFGFRLPRERFLWIVLVIILVALILVLAHRNVENESRLAGDQRRDKALNDQIAQMRSLLKETLPQRQPEPVGQLLTLYDSDITPLREKGLQGPVKDLTDDLMKHPELIPYKGVLGGQMGFYSEKRIYVLSSKWVLADFEDGHIGGRMLLECQVSPGGKISWRVIDSYMIDGTHHEKRWPRP